MSEYTGKQMPSEHNDTRREQDTKKLSRRNFLAFAAMGTVLAAEACREQGSNPTDPNAIELGRSDIGAMNFLYVVERFQHEFLGRLLQNAASPGFTQQEIGIITEMREHDGYHAAFMRQELGAAAIREIRSEDFDFSTLVMADRSAAIAQAVKFKDMSAKAYGGVLRVLFSSQNLRSMIKISSVESRHAQAWRQIAGGNPLDLIVNGSPATGEEWRKELPLATNGLERLQRSNTVLNVINTYSKIKFSAASLPKE